jgi:hypothetical protein
MDWANPALALIAGMVLVGFSAFAAMRAPAGRTSDPLADLFASETLEKELARVDLRAVRPCGYNQPRDYGETYTDTPSNVAQMLRAGSWASPQRTGAAKFAGESQVADWEEVLLLPPPSPTNTGDVTAT